MITFLNLIVLQSAITNTYLDGAAITNFVEVTNSGYWAARVSVAAGTNYTVSSSQPVEVQVYGFSDDASPYGGNDAYGYIGGVITFP